MRCFSCAILRSRSSAFLRSAASMRCVATSSAFRICSKCSWCARIAASSSSSITSIRPCSRVLPTRTSKIGSTSKSKSKRSPFSICVSTSTPIFMGMKSGVGGRSINASVCVITSASGTVSASSSRNASVWISMCRLPSTGSGVPGGRRRGARGKERAGKARSAGADAYVFPRITRRSNMMLLG